MKKSIKLSLILTITFGVLAFFYLQSGMNDIPQQEIVSESIKIQ